jgi:hypothetical protein
VVFPTPPLPLMAIFIRQLLIRVSEPLLNYYRKLATRAVAQCGLSRLLPA